jgi:hypothetical protein
MAPGLDHHAKIMIFIVEAGVPGCCSNLNLEGSTLCLTGDVLVSNQRQRCSVQLQVMNEQRVI